MFRYDRQMQEFLRDKFRRMVLAAVSGVTLAHLLSMSASTVFVGMYPTLILMTMDHFSLRELIKRCFFLLAGMIAGTLAIELFENIPVLAVFVTYAVFLGVLKLFALRKEVTNAYCFLFTYSLGSIYSSYPDSTMELSICQDYLIQMFLIFFLVWGCYALFPSEKPPQFRTPPLPPAAVIRDFELAVYALIWLGIWLVFLFFEWRFALFAFLSFVGAFRFFERRTMKKIARENIIAHVLCCSVAALFSLLMLGLIGNVLLMVLGLLLLLIPFIHFAVYPPREELRYRGTTMISGILVPLILYLSTEHAAVNQSLLRATLIVFLMLILWFVVEYLYYGSNVIRKVSDKVPAPERVRFRVRRYYLGVLIGGRRILQKRKAVPNA